MKKRILLVVLSICFLLSVGLAAGCGGGGGGGKQAKVTITPATSEIAVGGGVQLNAVTENYTGDVTWSSSSDAIATVSDSGYVIGVSIGDATITATAGEATGTCTVSVKAASYFPQLVVNQKNVSIYKDCDFDITAVVTVNGVEHDCTVTVESNDTSKVTVDGATITGVAVGTTTLTVSTEYQGEVLEETVNVTVKENVALTVLANDVRLAVSEINPEDITEKTVEAELTFNGVKQDSATITWSSGNPSIATVDNDGKIASVASGVATVTATCEFESNTYTAWTNVIVYKSLVSGTYDLGENDLSEGSITVNLSDIGVSSASGEFKFIEKATNKDFAGTVNSGANTATVNNVQFMKWGENEYSAELSDRIVNVTMTNITKILKTSSDIQNIMTICGGASGEAYSGYLVLGNNIDMTGVTVTGATNLEVKKNGAIGFNGVFDGKGFTVANAKITGQGGLFERVGFDGVVKNLSLVNIEYASGGSYYNGVLGFEYFGTLENYHFNGYYTGVKTGLCAIAGYSNNITVKNAVLEIAAAGVPGSAAIQWIQTSGTVWDNVYSISEVPFIGNNQELAVQRGNGYTEYKWNDANKSFTGLPSDIWTVESGKLPRFKSEDGFVADYKVEYYLQNASNTYDATPYSAAIFKGNVGATITAQDISVAGYALDRDAANVVSGVITENGSLTLKKYYAKNVTIAIGNTGGKGVFNIYDKSNSSNIAIKNVGQIDGKEAVMYKRYGGDNWYTRLWIEGISNSEIMADYKALEMYVYVKDSTRLDMSVYHFDEALDNTTINSKEALNATASAWFKIYDADGERTVSMTSNAWYKVVVNLTKLPTASYQNFYIYTTGLGEVYFSGVTLTNETFAEGEEKAAYTVEHYKRLYDGTYEKFKTDSLEGIMFSTVSAEATELKGYFINDNYTGNVKSGLVKSGGSLVLKLYYDEAIAIGNSEDKAYFYSLTGSNQSYGSNAIVMKKETSEIGGRTDAYSFTQTAGDCVRIVGAKSNYLTANGYNKMSMKLYFTEDFNAAAVLMGLYNSNGTITIRINKSNIANPANTAGAPYYRMLDAEGNLIDGDITSNLKNTWITLEVILFSVLDNNNLGGGMNFEMRLDVTKEDYADMAGKPLYIADVNFFGTDYLYDHYGYIEIDNSDDKGYLGVTYPTAFIGECWHKIAIENVGTFEGKDNVSSVIDNNAARRQYQLTIMGVNPAYLSSKGLTKISFDLYYTSGCTVTVFGYNTQAANSYKFAATLNATGDVSGAASYITIKDASGNKVGAVGSGAWYTVEIDISSIPGSTKQLDGSVMFTIGHELNAIYYLANVKFI